MKNKCSLNFASAGADMFVNEDWKLVMWKHYFTYTAYLSLFLIVYFGVFMMLLFREFVPQVIPFAVLLFGWSLKGVIKR